MLPIHWATATGGFLTFAWLPLPVYLERLGNSGSLAIHLIDVTRALTNVPEDESLLMALKLARGKVLHFATSTSPETGTEVEQIEPENLG